jgi:hypothetical protein
LLPAVQVTLVPFHPNFLRWRGLPKGIHIGSVVQSYKPAFGGCGFQKSPHPCPATVIETKNPVFGLRKIRVRFHIDPRNDNSNEQDDRSNRQQQRLEHYVPVDWLVLDRPGAGSGDGNVGHNVGDPLPDNAMHRAPYPTVHLIRNEDLGTLRARDVSRVKRKNAQKMLKLGWEGIQARWPTTSS